ncbi:Ribosomal RNA small subunit methyltransferase A [Candidatus Hodgkinia cicadicola]|nr:Ribosomal RNA small subunit methyltransferase A [Candidatus Hodgkinia cicadicola]
MACVLFGASLGLFVSSLPHDVIARLLTLLSQAECAKLIGFSEGNVLQGQSNCSKLSLDFIRCSVRKPFDVPFIQVSAEAQR